MAKDNIISTINNLAKQYDKQDESILKVLDLIQCVDVPQRLLDMAFIILTPDSIINNKTREIIEYVCEKTQCKIISAKLKYLDDFQIEELYKYTFQKKIANNEQTFWWLMRRSFQNTPCIALILYSEHHTKQFFCETLLEMKGSYAIPSNFTGETIRQRFDAFSRILAVIHSSDDVLCLLREAGLFFSKQELQCLLSSTCVNNPISIETICDLTVPDTEGHIIETMRKRLRATLQIDSSDNYYLKEARQILASSKEDAIPLTNYGFLIRKANIYFSEWDEIYLLNKIFFEKQR